MVKGRELCKYTGYDYGSCALPFFLLTSIFKQSFTSIPLYFPRHDLGMHQL